MGGVIHNVVKAAVSAVLIVAAFATPIPGNLPFLMMACGIWMFAEAVIDIVASLTSR